MASAVHIQPQFAEARLVVLHDLIRACPLATFIVAPSSEIVIDHIPFVVSTDGGTYGVLKGHVPRANSIWEKFDGTTGAAAVFQGPSSYVTPSWYPSKQLHGKVVPTWNYVVVHAHGWPHAIQDEAWLLEHLNELVDQRESERRLPWKVADAPDEYVRKMVGRIVGIEMPISVLQGKWKVSQNRSEEDRLGVAAGLRTQGDKNSLAMDALIRQGLE